MKNVWPTISLDKLICRKKDDVMIQDMETYKRLTIHMNGGGISIRDKVQGTEIGTKLQFVVKAGQLVLSKIDARNGAFGVVPLEGDNAIITGNFWAYDVDTKLLDVNFFNYLTKTPLFIDFCIRASDGTTNRLYLQEAKFLAQKILLPPLKEQQRIVARIEELAAKIEEARGLRREIFTGYEDLCRSMLFGKFASESKATPMRELVRLREPDVFVRPDDIYHFAGIYSFGKGVFQGQRRAGTEIAYSRLTRLHTNDFVYPKLMAWEGAYAIVPAICNGLVVSTEFPVFEINQERVLPETLAVYFHTPSVWPVLSGISTGTNARRRRLNPSDFLSWNFPLPNMERQLRLRTVKQKVDMLRHIKAETTAELDALLPSILDKAFKGEL